MTTLTRTLLGCVLAACAASAQTTRNVPAQFPTIQSAINASLNGDTVLVAPGNYAGPVNFLGRAVTVRGTSGATQTTIVGSPGSRVIVMSAGEGPGSVLDGFTIVGGSGGAILQNASPTITNCRFMANSVTPLSTGGLSYLPTQVLGGGIYCLASGGASSSPTITNCSFIGNTAWQGGGIYMEGQTTLVPTIMNCTFQSNGAVAGTYCPASSCIVYNGTGGALEFRGAGCSPTVLGCTFTGNVSAHDGAAISCDGTGASFISGCRILNNSSSVGTGGVAGSGTSLTLVNCLIAGNSTSATATTFGSAAAGGVGLAGTGTGSTLTLNGCTVTANQSSTLCGGVLLQGPAGTTATITNSIIWGNGALDHLNASGGSFSVSYSNVGAGNAALGGGVVLADPRFADAGSNDFHLGSTSPCRNAGSPGASGLPSTDIDGAARVVGSAVDMGCDEIPASTLAGSGEDLDLYLRVNGAGDPLATSRNAPAGSQVTLVLRSPGGAFTGTPPVVAGYLYPTGSPPPPLPGFPYIHYSGGVFLMAGALSPSPFSVPGLAPGGLRLDYSIPGGLSGATLRVQAVAVTGAAANTVFAATDAHDIVF